jgi:hypothetical protein
MRIPCGVASAHTPILDVCLHACEYLGSWIDGELQLGLLAVVDRQTLHQERGESYSINSMKLKIAVKIVQ